MNGDGYADIVVGADVAPNDAGKAIGGAYLYLGGPGGIVTTPSVSLANPASGPASFGLSVASAGDVNGDGYADVIVGAMDGQTNQEGRVYVYLGSAIGVASAFSSSLLGPLVGGYFGRSVATAGDVNGDGYSDVVVGAPGGKTGVPSAGNVYVYLGGGDGGLSTTPSTMINGLADGGLFGFSVASAGDEVGRGYAGIVVGAYAASNYTGTAQVFLSDGGLGASPSPATTLTGPGPASDYGYSMFGSTN